MPTPTDLRAALRAKLIAAYDAAWDTTGEGKNAEYTSARYTQEAYERERDEAIDKFLADAPPTVAELLPLVDATHEVHWEAHGEERRIYAPDGGAIVCEYRTSRTRWVRWMEARLTVFDLRRHGRLVEVSP